MNNEIDLAEKPGLKKGLRPWLLALLLLCILTVGAYLRFTGISWDADQHLHPDERFLTMVSSAIEPVENLGDYFDTANSSLNPHNRGYTFYVYGTLPLFVVRYVGEWLEMTGYGDIHIVGRALSAVMDLLTVMLVFATAERLYDRRVGVLAAAFAAVAVLPIQQSHFYTVDTFASFFMMLAVFIAVEIATSRKQAAVAEDDEPRGTNETQAVATDPLVVVSEESAVTQNQIASKGVSGYRRFLTHPLLVPGLAFGAALGMAVASKINAAPIAVILPLAAGLYLLKLSPDEQRRQALQVFIYLVLAAVTSLLIFRIFQPYAFSGPGFFGIKPNQAWVDNMTAVRAQTGGDVDFPPALQWARRPLTFSWQNMVLWGLGLPLGILAWTGFVIMAWRMLKGAWQKHILLWGWTAAYFGWQSLQWNSTMRYQLPIYPLLAIMAAWFMVGLFDRGRKTGDSGLRSPVSGRIYKWGAIGLGALVLIATILWAYAFMGIYPRDHTRIAASRWLFQEMPGPITLEIDQSDATYNQPLPFYEGTLIHAGQPYEIGFEAFASGPLSQIYLPHVVDQMAVLEPTVLSAQVSYSAGDVNPITSGELQIDPASATEHGTYLISFDPVIALGTGQTYYLTLDVRSEAAELQVCSQLDLQFQPGEGQPERSISLPQECLSRADFPVTIPYAPEESGDLNGLSLQYSEYFEVYEAEAQTLRVELFADSQDTPLASGVLQDDFAPQPLADQRGEGYWVDLDQAVQLDSGQNYVLRFTLEEGAGTLTFAGAAAANESTWDDGLPLRMDGYDPYGGIYQGGLNFEMYWDDNAEKYERFVTTLDQADYVLISSSRQWGTTTRVPERYPLTSEYYRRLIGCPAEQTVEWCYTVADVGTFQGDLGFDLVQIFVSNPSAGPLEINDQFSEEAFTVYDHPKVFVFKKSDAYDPQQVRTILGAVDLSKVVHITPKQADSHPGNLMLPADRLAEQRSGGTWSELFDYQSLQNKYPLLSILIWYLTVSVLGWIIYPLVRYAMPGLSDRGYPLSRVAGLLLLAYLAWLAGSVRIPFSRVSIGVSLLIIAVLGGVLAYRQRDELRTEWREKRKYFLLVELLTLGFFAFGLLVRIGNPDLWHPWKGGEKPMDFSYFNAVLKSTSFPPYDPWFAGGYINYYYYGFVIVGVLVKFLGIVPAIAYNLILPTLLAMIALGAFSIGWNLVWRAEGGRMKVDLEPEPAISDSETPSTSPHPSSFTPHPSFINRHSLISGLIAALGMAIVGNLGTLRMILEGFRTAAAPVKDIAGAGFFSNLLWSIKGFFMTITGVSLPYRADEWYWNPSRTIGHEHGGPITEFPYFTFLYGDLHAHLIALPIALLAIAWALSVVLGRAWQRPGRRSPWQIGTGLFLGGLVIGALYPVNLSDIYTYLPLGVAALSYAVWMYGDAHDRAPNTTRRTIFLIGTVVVLIILALFLYQPYSQWYGQGYSEIQLWRGTRTPIGDYLTHWGAFLFVFITWMIYETIDWMAATPVSALRKLQPYRGLILTLIVALAVMILLFGFDRYPAGLPPEVELPIGLGVHVIWFVLPLAVWAGLLLLRPGISDAKRSAFFLMGTGLVLTLMVEIVVVSGDIGRMNTVFKFYLHVWALFSVSAAAALTWMWQSLSKWDLRWRLIWQVGLVFFVSCAAFYPLTATLAKVRDRMASQAPHTLDGMTYMQYATYFDADAEMDLSQDYAAIRWMQDNINGSPVIVEANMPEYHWGTRYTIYTGLPGVVGWNWHQRQQRTLLSDSWVWDRVNGIDAFYQTTDIDLASEFLTRYDVSYIVVGQLERAKYAGEGLEKFSDYNDSLWTEVYRDRDTVIYQVVRGE